MPTDVTVPPKASGQSCRQGSRPFNGANWLIFLSSALPATLFYFRVVDTYAPGALLVVLVAILLRWFAGSPAGSLTVPTLVCTGIAIHLALASSFQPMDWMRALSSLAFLFLLLLGSSSLATLLCRIPDDGFRMDMRNLGYVMLAITLLGLVGFAPPTLGASWPRPYFPFTEPAGLALPLAPVLMYFCVVVKGPYRALLMMLAVAGMALITTLTLAVAVALIALVSLRKSHLIIFATVMSAILSQVDLTYYTERVDFFSESTTNLSNLVYVQGWQLLFEGLERSQYLGQGFQQLGVHGTEVEAAQIINSLMGDDLNILDGSFLLPKLGAELGVFGLLVVAIATAQSLWSIVVLRRVAAGQMKLPPVLIFAHVTMAALLLRLYVRSGGYFNGEMILTLAAAWILIRHRAIQRRQVGVRKLPASNPSTHAH